ncbi:hypothetical protein HYZ99_03765 [Candidatus Peregrinibacteria bacterium]|nr:hypothetical protein [Candidatus Peregrinibacteria bacterium]
MNSMEQFWARDVPRELERRGLPPDAATVKPEPKTNGHALPQEMLAPVQTPKPLEESPEPVESDWNALQDIALPPKKSKMPPQIIGGVILALSTLFTEAKATSKHWVEMSKPISAKPASPELVIPEHMQRIIEIMNMFNPAPPAFAPQRMWLHRAKEELNPPPVPPDPGAPMDPPPQIPPKNLPHG